MDDDACGTFFCWWMDDSCDLCFCWRWIDDDAFGPCFLNKLAFFFVGSFFFVGLDTFLGS
jgi:hypothetical protein